MTGWICSSPENLEEVVPVLKDAINRKLFTAFFGRCWVEYEGRGASKSTPGDRLVVVKPSGSILVHGSKGFKPENWQPDGSVFHVDLINGILRLRAVRKKPREILIVWCDKIYTISGGMPSGEGAFIMYMSEAEIRDTLARHPEIVGEGLVPIEKEKPVETGFIDLYFKGPKGETVVVEIKRVKAGEDAVKQLAQYLEALRKRGVNAEGVLAAPGFTEAAVREAALRRIKLLYLDMRKLLRLREEERRRQLSLEDFLS